MIIVVGVDGSEQSVRALRWAVAEAGRSGAVVEAVHAWQLVVGTPAFGQVTYTSEDTDRAAHELLDEAISSVDQSGLAEPVRKVVGSGTPSMVLTRHATDADLLVVGTRGRGGFLSLLLGSVAEDCVHRSPCPLVLVPPEGPEASGAVMVGVDGSDESIAALRWALRRRTDADPPVVALYALNWHDQPAPAEFDPGFGEDDARTWLQDLIAEHVSDLASVTPQVVADVPSHALVARSEAGDLVVVGSRGAGRTMSFIAGSTARQLAHHAAAPVVIHRLGQVTAGTELS